ncbi:MAG TPA: AI-2E family transporter, partial [bacterium]|nr:AI-2E family transporter [bacterium]
MQNYVIYKFLFLLILFILFLSIIIFYSNLFFPIILGWIFAYIFSPIINYFEKLKIKRTIIIFAFCFILIIIIILIMLFIIPTIIEQLKEMINFFGRNIKKLNIERYINLPEFKKNIDFYIKLIRINQSYITNILQLTSDFVQLFYKGLLNIFMIISQIFIFIISFIYFIYHFEIINFLIKKYLPVELREKILTYLSEI